jgi:opacity protein-like surface antigen
MRKYLLAAVAAAAIATPAVARDGAPYVGLEAGLLMAEDTDFDLTTDFGLGAGQEQFSNAIVVNYSPGIDADLIVGYDFGMFRLEGEAAFKRASVDDVTGSFEFLSALEEAVGENVSSNDFDTDGRLRVLSFMGNALLDFGPDNGLQGYIGGGLGRAQVRIMGSSDGEWAYQGIAGVRLPVGALDLGLKYRYFNTGHLSIDGGDEDFEAGLTGRLRSHSLLASLIYNFVPPAVVVAPPPPPPPPPPPATQTCPDGSVILATDICPPPPPPPPPPAGERG